MWHWCRIICKAWNIFYIDRYTKSYSIGNLWRHNEDPMSINGGSDCCTYKTLYIHIHEARADSISLSSKAASWGVTVAQLACRPSFVSPNYFCLFLCELPYNGNSTKSQPPVMSGAQATDPTGTLENKKSMPLCRSVLRDLFNNRVL